MKKSQLRQIIKEEISKVLKKNNPNIPTNNYPQVDLEIQGEIYTIPVNMEDRERIFNGPNYDAENELEDILDAEGMSEEGRSGSAIASDLRQQDVTDRFGNLDTKLFKRIKSLGVQVDALNGMLDDRIERAATSLHPGSLKGLKGW